MARVPLTTQTHIADGRTIEWGFSFPYASKGDVFVTVNGASYPAFKWVSEDTISISPALPQGARIVIYRDTDAYSMLYEYQLGAPFIPRYVDADNAQLLYAVQELSGQQERAKADTEDLIEATRKDLDKAIDAEAHFREQQDSILRRAIAAHTPSEGALQDSIVGSSEGVYNPLSTWTSIAGGYSTVAALQKDSSVSSGSIVSTQGYHRVGDQGSTSYKVKAGPSNVPGEVHLDNGLYAEPIFGRVVNLRQLGLPDGGDITKYIMMMPQLPNKELEVPLGTFKSEVIGNTVSLTERGSYGLHIPEGAKIVCSTQSEDLSKTYFWRIGSPLLNNPSYILMNNFEDYGYKVAEDAEPGSSSLVMESLPAGLQEGDSVNIIANRATEGECRGINSEGQSAFVKKISGNTIELSHPLLFRYNKAVNPATIKGRVSGKVKSTGSSNGRGTYTYVPVEFTDGTNPDVFREDYLGLMEFSTRDSKGNAVSVYPTDYDQDTHTFVFHWHPLAATPAQGDTFEITTASRVMFRPRTSFTLRGRGVVTLDTDATSEVHNKVGDSFLEVWGSLTTIDNITVSKFGGTCIEVNGSVGGWQRSTYYDGLFKQSHTFDSHGFSLGTGNHGFVSTDVTVRSYGQGINTGGSPLPSTKCKYMRYTYSGGGYNYDGTPNWPWSNAYENDPNSDKTFTSSAITSHGGSYWTVIDGADIMNSSSPLSIRGRQETVTNVNLLGAIGSSTLFNFAGVTLRNWTYNPIASNSTVDYDEVYESSLKSAVINVDVSLGKGWLRQNYPTIIRDFDMERLGGPIVRFDQRNAHIRNFEWGGLVSGYPVKGYSGYAGSVVGYAGSGRVYVAHGLNHGGNYVKNYNSAGKAGGVVLEAWDSVVPEPGDFFYAGNHTAVLNVPKGGVVALPINRGRTGILAFTFQHYLHNNASLLYGTIKDAGGEVGTAMPGNAGKFKGLSSKPTGTSGEDGTIGMFYTSGSSSEAAVLYVENRLEDNGFFSITFM